MEYEKTEVETTFVSEEDVITITEHLDLGVTTIMVNGIEFLPLHPDFERLKGLVGDITMNL